VTRYLLVIGFPDERFGVLGTDHLHSLQDSEREALMALEVSDARFGRSHFHDLVEVNRPTDVCPRCQRSIEDLYGPQRPLL